MSGAHHKIETPESSMFTAFEFHPSDQQIALTFRGTGTTYLYPCTDDQYNDFVAAESKGKHFNAHFDRKSGKKVEPAA